MKKEKFSCEWDLNPRLLDKYSRRLRLRTHGVVFARARRGCGSAVLFLNSRSRLFARSRSRRGCEHRPQTWRAMTARRAVVSWISIRPAPRRPPRSPANRSQSVRAPPAEAAGDRGPRDSTLFSACAAGTANNRAHRGRKTRRELCFNFLHTYLYSTEAAGPQPRRARAKIAP